MVDKSVLTAPISAVFAAIFVSAPVNRVPCASILSLFVLILALNPLSAPSALLFSLEIAVVFAAIFVVFVLILVVCPATVVFNVEIPVVLVETAFAKVLWLVKVA